MLFAEDGASIVNHRQRKLYRVLTVVDINLVDYAIARHISWSRRCAGSLTRTVQKCKNYGSVCSKLGYLVASESDLVKRKTALAVTCQSGFQGFEI
jgi:hypothetical protein